MNLQFYVMRYAIPVVHDAIILVLLHDSHSATVVTVLDIIQLAMVGFTCGWGKPDKDYYCMAILNGICDFWFSRPVEEDRVSSFVLMYIILALSEQFSFYIA